MGNAFMPSAFSSLNAAGAGTLEQIMKQRLFEQEMLRSQFGMQRQFGADQEQSRRFDAQERYQQGLLADRAQDNDTRLRIAQGKLEADAQTAQSEQQARAAIVKVMEAGDYALAQRLAVGAGITTPREPTKVKTREERDADIRQDVLTRESAKAEADRLNPKPTKGKVSKPPKDTPGLPGGFKAALANRIGSTGFENRDAAFKSIQAQWPKWRANYPSLDASMVKSELDNLYGPRDSGGLDLGALRAKLAARMTAPK